jgi:hypothetical protein
MEMLYYAVGGVIVLVFVLYGFVFFLKKKQIKSKKERLEAEARAAIKEADAERGFVPHK